LSERYRAAWSATWPRPIRPAPGSTDHDAAPRLHVEPERSQNVGAGQEVSVTDIVISWHQASQGHLGGGLPRLWRLAIPQP
jgi:hypothetical protein